MTRVTVIREPVPGLILAGYLCVDCRSCDRHGVCHVVRQYVGRWNSTCSRFRVRPAAEEAAKHAQRQREEAIAMEPVTPDP